MNLILTLLIFSCLFLIFKVVHLRQKISKQSAAEKLLLESEHRFQSLLESIPNISVQGYDSNRRVIFWNEASEHLYGYSKNEAIGQLLEDLIIPDEMKSVVIDATHNLMTNGTPIPAGELILKTKNEEPINVYSSHVMQYDRNGNPEMYCLDIDLSAHKHDEIALQQSEQRALDIIKASPVPFALHNSQKDVVYINKAFTDQFGYTIEDIPTYNEWGFKVYPSQEYAKNIQRIWNQRIRDSIQNKTAFEPLEIEIRCKNNDHKIVLAQATLLPESDSGEVLISLYDITERKKSEEILQLAATVFRHSSEAMMTSDANRIVVAINPAFTDITGYGEDDILGVRALALISDKHDPAFYVQLRQELDDNGKWQGEVWCRKKDGTDFLSWMTVNTIYNDNGGVHQRVGLFSDITEKKNAEMLAIKQSNYDSLTSLPNRNMFNDRLDQEIKKVARSNKLLAVFFLDLDRFKEVNDTFGHPVGDKLLIDSAKRISDCVRDTDTVARLGGDEFTVILPELDDSHGIERIAHKIIDSLSQPFKLGNHMAYVSASIGITLYPNDADNTEGLLKNADQAMYFAKDSGRSRFSYFTQQMQRSSLERFHLTNDLRLALTKNEFELYYQPIINLANGKIHKAEALIRWKHPERGMVSPAEFIPLAEESGLILEIGNWVFQQAIRQVKTCLQFNDDFQISINMSPIQLKEQTDWTSLISQENISGKNVVVEITEGVLIEDNEQVAEQLLNFQDAGIEVAIDDFGTGYSSLSYLNKFDIDYLKIDQSFIRNLAPDSNEMALSEAIIVMAHKLGLKVIAEGVETEQQRDLLVSAGCNSIQGYLLSKPLPENEFNSLLGLDKA